MQITPFTVRVKSRLYSKKPSLRAIFDDPMLVLYFDSALYRPLLSGDIEGDAMATFPNGWPLVAPPSCEMPAAEDGLTGGRLIMLPVDDEEPARLLALDSEEGSTLQVLDDIFEEGSWSVFICASDIESSGSDSSLVDFQDGSLGYFRINLSSDEKISVYYGTGVLDDPEVLSPSVDANGDCWVCVRKDNLTYEVIVNGESILSYEFEEPSSLSLVQGAIGGRFSSMSIESAVAAKLSMFAVFNDAISDTQLKRLSARAQLLNRGVEYELPSEIPAFIEDPSLSGGALPDAPVVGDVLTVSGHEVTGYPTPDITYEWRADSEPITGAETSMYTVLIGDVGKVITAAVFATNRAGTTGAETDPTEEVVAE